MLNIGAISTTIQYGGILVSGRPAVVIISSQHITTRNALHDAHLRTAEGGPLEASGCARHCKRSQCTRAPGCSPVALPLQRHATAAAAGVKKTRFSPVKARGVANLFGKTLDALGCMEAALEARIFPALLRSSNVEEHLTDLETAMLEDVMVFAKAHAVVVRELNQMNDALKAKLIETMNALEAANAQQQKQKEDEPVAVSDDAFIQAAVEACIADVEDKVAVEREIASWLKEF